MSTLMMRTLQKLLDKLVDRRDSNILSHQLLHKVEYVISCLLTEMQMQLYDNYLVTFLGIGRGQEFTNLSSNEKLFQHGMLLLMICNHLAVCCMVLNGHLQQQESSGACRHILLQDDMLDLLDIEVIDK
ncbi:hypothetical protein IWW55_004126 [Coemansia sp. RSA 2706]|nr:hypothetical protein IWW55_004126 [Coemansia sp. RSA 2706]